jgi:hypothetical protein
VVIYRFADMRRISGFSDAGAGGSGAIAPAVVLAQCLAELAEVDPCAYDEAAALETITAIEKVKRAASAAQAVLSQRVDELARERQRNAGVASRQLGQGVGAQIALARLESPHRGGRHLGLA